MWEVYPLRFDMNNTPIPDKKYIVITPAFNEQDNIQKTINSMINQKFKTNIWVIVDDGSFDNTIMVAKEAAKEFDWIHVIQNQKKQNINHDGLIEASEAKAFLKGYQYALTHCPCFDFIVKLDADLEFGPDYFLNLANRFVNDDNLGLAGGIIFEYKDGKLVKDRVSSAHVRGATKMYRQNCYSDIGGIRPIFGWDVIDEMMVREKGWKVESFEDLHLIHLRRTASRVGRFKGWVRNGYMAYYIGMSPGKILLRSLFRLLVVADPVQAAGLFWGYFFNWLKRRERLALDDVLRIVKKNQWY